MAKVQYVFHMTLSERNLLLNALMAFHNSLVRKGNTNFELVDLLQKVLETSAQKDSERSCREER